MADEQVTQDEASVAANPKTGAPMSEVKSKGIGLLLDIPLEASVEVGRAKILVRELLQMTEGYVVELDKLAGETLDLYVNDRLIARGEAVVVNDKFGLRLTDVVSPAERIENLG